MRLSVSAPEFKPRAASAQSSQRPPPPDEIGTETDLARKLRTGHATCRKRKPKKKKPKKAEKEAGDEEGEERSLGEVESAQMWLSLYSIWVHTKRSASSDAQEEAVDEIMRDNIEQRRWSEWAMHAAENERERRLMEADALDRAEKEDRRARGQWAIAAIEAERMERVTLNYLVSLSSTNWFNELVSTFNDDYELVCPHYRMGCRANCRRSNLFTHLETCEFGDRESSGKLDFLLLQSSYEEAVRFEVICPNAVLGCTFQGGRSDIMDHLVVCGHRGPTPAAEQEERRQIILSAIAACEQERERRLLGDAQEPSAGPSDLVYVLRRQNRVLLGALSEQIQRFWAGFRERQERERGACEEAIAILRSRVATLWPFARVEVVGSFSFGLWGRTVHSDPRDEPGGRDDAGDQICRSDLDLVVCFSDASQGLLRLRGSLLNVLAGHLVGGASSSSSSTPDSSIFSVSRMLLSARIPVLKGKLTFDTSALDAGGGLQRVSVAVDMALDGATHSGLAASTMCQTLLQHLEPLAPLACLLKEALRVRGLGDSYTGGLGGYGCLLLALLPLLRKFWGKDKGSEGTLAHPAHSVPPSPSRHSSAGSPCPRRQGRSASLGAASVGESPVVPPQRSPSLSLSHSSPGPYTFPAKPEQPESVLHSFHGIDRQRAYGRTVAHLLLYGEGGGERDEPDLEQWEGWRPSDASELSEAASASPSEELGPLLEAMLSYYSDCHDSNRAGYSLRNGGFSFDLEVEPLHPVAVTPDRSPVAMLLEDPVDLLYNVAHTCYRASAIHRCVGGLLTEMRQAAVRGDGRALWSLMLKNN